jgi:hypothetical protein
VPMEGRCSLRPHPNLLNLILRCCLCSSSLKAPVNT